ncbi:MAG: isoprenyl transferase [Deltaproteobacteria bacterium]|nr:isoprenyl transferase [Deltaproteobacteria bacterium]
MERLNPDKLPQHVAIIMDGNGRWAKRRGLTRIVGHRKGIESVRDVVKTSRELGIKWLTLYAFSEENWKRPQYEIKALMNLLTRYLTTESKEMLDNGIRLLSIGQTEKLPAEVQRTLWQTIEKTAHNEEMNLTLALSYGGRQEIVWAVKNMLKDIEKATLNIKQITEERLSHYLYTSHIPDPDLLIRTSGEYRISNFLLWQIAYTEIFVSPILWPDFHRERYLEALLDYQKRERRFGSTGEQITPPKKKDKI